MRRRDFFRRMGAAGVLPEPQHLQLPCDVLQVQYAQALLEGRTDEFMADLRNQLEAADTVTVRNGGLLRGETLQLFEDLFHEFQARGKRLERRN